jgi:PAS domain-containing protein
VRSTVREGDRSAVAYLIIPLVQEDSAPLAAEESTDPRIVAREPELRVEPLAAWVAVASGSVDACLVLDDRGRVAGCSQPAGELLGELPKEMVGRPLVGDVIEVVDFSAQAGPGDSYALRIPPLLALTSERPTRGLLRVRHGNGRRVTLDAVSAPVHAVGGILAGSVSFFTAIAPG